LSCGRPYLVGLWGEQDRLAVESRVYAAGSVAIGSAWSSGQIKEGGQFSIYHEIIGENVRQISIALYPSWRGGRGVTEKVIFEYNQLECFLLLIDPYEKTRPSSKTHLEFLSAVRKIFQPAQGSPLKRLFPIFLYRNRNVPPLFKENSIDWNKVHRFENIDIAGTLVDLGHVLIGIEASRRQQPGLGGSGYGLLSGPREDLTEALLTWAGDLGGVLAWVALETASGRKPNMQTLLTQKASYADLTGDIDGINIGAVYDDSQSLAENARKYYEATPFRRFHNFIANARKENPPQPVLTVTPGKPSKFDTASRAAVAYYLEEFVRPYFQWPGKAAAASCCAKHTPGGRRWRSDTQ
jgi:hypothetical protein